MGDSCALKSDAYLIKNYVRKYFLFTRPLQGSPIHEFKICPGWLKTMLGDLESSCDLTSNFYFYFLNEKSCF